MNLYILILFTAVIVVSCSAVVITLYFLLKYENDFAFPIMMLILMGAAALIGSVFTLVKF